MTEYNATINDVAMVAVMGAQWRPHCLSSRNVGDRREVVDVRRLTAVTS